MAKDLTRKKAKKILKHGKVRGKPISKKFRGKLGAIAGGNERR